MNKIIKNWIIKKFVFIEDDNIIININNQDIKKINIVDTLNKGLKMIQIFTKATYFSMCFNTKDVSIEYEDHETLVFRRKKRLVFRSKEN
jgi:hypothetical protein